MGEDNQNFCVKCGATLSQDDKFCPSCGARVPGRSPEQVAAEKEAITTMLSKKIRWPAYLMLIYAIPFLFMAIYLFIDLDGIVDILVNDANFAELGLSYDETVSLVETVRLAYVISSVCGIISATLCFIRKYYWIAIITCFVSMFTGVAGFFALFLGLFAFWMILTSKMAFLEYSDQLESELGKIQ